MLYENTIQNISGEDVSEVTPVPIPNTEVKLEVAEDSKGTPLVKIGVCQIFLCQFLSSRRVIFLYIKLYLSLFILLYVCNYIFIHIKTNNVNNQTPYPDILVQKR